MTKKKRSPEVIGWREHVSLPDLGIADIAAKLDTGARTAALHAVDQQTFNQGGDLWVEFMIPAHNKPSKTRVRQRVVDERKVKNTGGVPELRLIIRTSLLIGLHRWQIEVSLANRAKMEYDLILGRTAIRRRHILIDAGRSFLLDPPTPKTTPESPQTFASLAAELKGRSE